MYLKNIISYITIIVFVIFTIWSVLFRVTVSITFNVIPNNIITKNLIQDNYTYDNLSLSNSDRDNYNNCNDYNNSNYSKKSSISNKRNKININSYDVFVKQQSNDTCTLAAATMMLRRKAILNNNSWKNITEKSLYKYAWVDGAGLRWEFNYAGMCVQNAQFDKNDKQNQIKKLLQIHPEGIVIYYYDNVKQHAILLTDYTNGVFYCADPSNLTPKGRIALSTEQIVNVDNAIDYWYII